MNFKHKSILFLTIMSVIILIIFAVYLFGERENSTKVINIAGKQRMLSQQIAFLANSLLVKNNKIHQDEILGIMSSSLSLFQSDHQLLIAGDANPESPVLSGTLKEIYFQEPYRLDAQVKHFILLSQKVIDAAKNYTLTSDSTALKAISSAALHPLLESLDIAVWQFQKSAESYEKKQKIIFLLMLSFMAVILLLGIHEGYAVITELGKNNELLKLSKIVFDHSVDGIITTDGEGKIIASSDRVRELTGYSSGALVGRKLSSFITNISTHEGIVDEMMEVTALTGEWRGEIIQRATDAKPISAGIRSVYDAADGKPTIINYIMIITDISEQKASEEKFRFLSMHDPLTGLLSRAALYQECESLIAIAKREKQQLYVMMMDLDGFKQANDTYGHDAGDYVLVEVSKRIQDVLRGSDILARFGGDEFIVLALQGGGESHPENIAKKILQAVCEPVPWRGDEIEIGISIGIAAYPDAGDHLDVLLGKADAEMYKVKQKGKNNFSIYK